MVMKFGTIPGILLIGFGAVVLNLGIWTTMAIALAAAVLMLGADHLLERRHARSTVDVREDA